MLTQSFQARIQQHLTSLHSDGHQLQLPELMRYHTQVLALRSQRRKQPNRSQSGAILSRHKGRGMEFDEVRQYQAGDDIRSIDWRVTARTGSPHTKLYREEQERPIILLVDFSPSMLFGTQLLLKSVQAAHIAAAIAWSTVQQGDRVGAIVTNSHGHSEVRPRGRQQGALQILHALLDRHQQALTSSSSISPESSAEHAFEQALRRLLQVAKPGTDIHLISDFQHLSSSFRQQLNALTRHCQVRAWRLSDPFEWQLPETQSDDTLLLDDGHQRAKVQLASLQQRQLYAATNRDYLQGLSAALKTARIPLAEVTASTPLTEQWLQLVWS